MSDAEYTGPLNFAVFAIPGDADRAALAVEIRGLAADHRAEILDVELMSRAEDGSAVLVELPPELAGAGLGLLDEDDLAVAVEDLAAGELALVVVYEDRTLAVLAGRVRAVSGRELWVGGVEPVDLDGPLRASGHDETGGPR